MRENQMDPMDPASRTQQKMRENAMDPVPLAPDPVKDARKMRENLAGPMDRMGTGPYQRCGKSSGASQECVGTTWNKRHVEGAGKPKGPALGKLMAEYIESALFARPAATTRNTHFTTQGLSRDSVSVITCGSCALL